MNEATPPGTARTVAAGGAHAPEAASSPDHGNPKPRRRGLGWLMAGAGIVIMLGLATFGIIKRNNNVAALQAVADDASVPKVTLVSPEKGPASRTLTLPGETQAWFQAPIFAQVTGYVKKWYKDYGDPVTKGELLATIETPDLDQELQQARSQLEVEKTHAELAKVTAERWQKLAGTQAVSQETVDVNIANYKAQQARVSAAAFNVARYESKEAFKQVVAPFDGIVTARYTDVGAFVNAAGGSAGQQGHTQELFSVADIHELRLFVSVPQDYSGFIKPDLQVTVTLPQFPNQTFQAAVLTTAKSFNRTARTILTELTMQNPKRDIFPGSFAQVKFVVPTDPAILVVPEQALLFRAKGLQVALVDSSSKVHLQDVAIGLNFGQTVQVTKGLKATDKLIANPSDGLLEGQTVKVVQTSPDNANDNPPANPTAKAPGH